MNNIEYKTFEELGLVFSEDLGCQTCSALSCHNNVPSKINGEEFNVHISMDENRTEFRVHATQNSSTATASDIHADFSIEEDAVSFVCNNFEWFKCF